MGQMEEKSTRDRILEAAGEIFGLQGFKAATVRDICRKAGVNVALVNYHFGSKENLYRELGRDLVTQTFSRFPVDVFDPDAPAEVRLRAFVHATLSRLLSPGGLTGYPGRGQLMARELADPSPILDNLVEDFIRPTAQVLAGIVAELLGPEARDRDVMKGQISVIGQCSHYAVARPLITRLFAFDPSDQQNIEDLADHVTRFSLAGLASMRQRLEHPTEKPSDPSRNKGD
ncbi:MAG: CerR family C-terminal domain-containing protein [Proteobacteria bacterium]|nr:CerR family C-terminal domain-containing protein [Pseudomonadota bacterium]